MFTGIGSPEECNKDSVLAPTAVWLGNLLLPNKLLLLAERRNALSTLDYSMASGADNAANTRTEVDAAMKRTAEEVGLQGCLHVS